MSLVLRHLNKNNQLGNPFLTCIRLGNYLVLLLADEIPTI